MVIDNSHKVNDVNSEEKERIGILVSKGLKKKWLDFTKENKISTISKLVRDGVQYYMNSMEDYIILKNFSHFSHDIVESLTSIRILRAIS